MMRRFPRMTSVARDQRGGVALMFGVLLLPTLMVVGLAVDDSFYVQAQSQLNLGADAAALHAVRAASSAFSISKDATAALQAGDTAGRQWFASQVGLLNTASVQISTLPIVTYTQSPPGFSGAVSYSGTVASHLGAAFGFLTYPIAGNASAVVSDSYVEVLMLLDNSSSMAIAATTADIVTMEKATICSTLPSTATQGMSSYSWSNGSCNYTTYTYTGDPSTCFNPNTVRDAGGNLIIGSNGKCANGGGVSGTPQAPCAFACHTASSNDSYALSKSLGVTLRINVVRDAAVQVITNLAGSRQSPNQFSVGVYTFRESTNPTGYLLQVYPTNGSEAGTVLIPVDAPGGVAVASTIVSAMSPPTVTNNGDTDFADAANALAARMLPAGNGSSQVTPLKNLFIVTDGMNDLPTPSGNNRPMGPITTTCQQFQNLGINVFVLYTPYLPLPNPFYLQYDKKYAEPTTSSPILAALKACASTPANFFQASDPAAINTAMQQMLQSALNSPARVAQ